MNGNVSRLCCTKTSSKHVKIDPFFFQKTIFSKIYLKCEQQLQYCLTGSLIFVFITETMAEHVGFGSSFCRSSSHAIGFPSPSVCHRRQSYLPRSQIPYQISHLPLLASLQFLVTIITHDTQLRLGYGRHPPHRFCGGLP